jgi:DNA-binding SARP family transcriptional activator/tetratricopeptide (TPR) repeat protein
VADGAGDRVAVAGPRLRVLLAALLLHANIPVPAGELVELVWDGSPPPGAIATLRSYVRRLRAAVDPGTARITTSGPGYVIRVEQDELDVLEFEALCRDTRAALRACAWADASAAATRALGLWRAAPLLDVPAEALRGEFVPRLERLRLQVLEDHFDAGLRLEQCQELIPQLLEVTARHPLQERFHAQLMLALAGTGQRAQALSAYQQARQVLITELGIEPGPDLRDIHQQILAGDASHPAGGAEDGRPAAAPDPAVTGAPEGPARAVAGPAVAGTAGPVPGRPAQLPATIADFTGRQAQAAYLRDALAGEEAAPGSGIVPVAVVAGAAGRGKTTLAVHVAHQVRDLFADGQLYAHLSGASGQPAAPAEVQARFLRDLGLDGGQIPAGEQERTALYRTQLAGRRVLILLDDAKDAAQVRPLLPGSGPCAVVVTTRNRTPFLVSTGFVDLGILPDSEARELLARTAGRARLAAEPDAAAEVLRACAGLPLAIRICAARLATRPRWPIATMAARLRDERRRLDELQIGDLEIRASFQLSYDSLRAGRQPADPARTFRRLGLWPGQRISLPAAAALTGEREDDLAGALETLVDANLLESPAPDWYQFHDLMRLFAAERAQAEESPQARLAAVTRLLRWYLATATAAADLLSPHRYRIPDDAPPAPGPPPVGAQDALAWYDQENASLLTAIRQAAATGLHELAWRLPTALFELFGRRFNWADCITAHRVAVTSARLAGSRPGEAWALNNLGWALASVGDAEAFGCLSRAASIRRELKDLDGEHQAAITLSEAHYRIHGPQAAYDHSLSCLERLRQTGNPHTLAAGLNNLSNHCRDLGRLEEAAGYLREALGIYRDIGGGHGPGHALENLGRIQLMSGRLDEAIASLSQAHRLHLAQGHLLGQAQSLRDLGRAQHAAGQLSQARQSLGAALPLFRDLNATAEVESIQSALRSHDLS